MSIVVCSHYSDSREKKTVPKDTVLIFYISINTSGMVMQERICETTAMPDAVEGSLPYALGITIVLSPRGIASEHTAHMYVVCERGRSFAIRINAIG